MRLSYDQYEVLVGYKTLVHNYQVLYQSQYRISFWVELVEDTIKTKIDTALTVPMILTMYEYWHTGTSNLVDWEGYREFSSDVLTKLSSKLKALAPTIEKVKTIALEEGIALLFTPPLALASASPIVLSSDDVNNWVADVYGLPITRDLHTLLPEYKFLVHKYQLLYQQQQRNHFWVDWIEDWLREKIADALTVHMILTMYDYWQTSTSNLVDCERNRKFSSDVLTKLSSKLKALAPTIEKLKAIALEEGIALVEGIADVYRPPRA